MGFVNQDGQILQLKSDELSSSSNDWVKRTESDIFAGFIKPRFWLTTSSPIFF